MKVSEIVAWLDANGVALAAVGVALAGVWYALPRALRDAVERRYPRLVGVVRVLAALLPDLAKVYFAVRHQLVAGRPKRPAPTTATIESAAGESLR